MRIILTHDIDSISKPITHILKRWRRFSLKDIALRVLGLRSIYNNLRELELLEERFGYRSTLFVPVVLFPLDPIVDQLQKMVDRGWEIALHFVVEGHQTKSLIILERERLEAFFGKVWGVRTHMLQVSDDLLIEYYRAGFRYDSTLRAEECGRYEPFRLYKGMIEIPIGLMDADLFGRLNMREEEAWEYMVRKIGEAEMRGVKEFTILFHQESLRMKGGRLYQNLLEYFDERGYQVSRCRDVI